MAILKRLHYTPKKYPNIAYHKIYTFNVYNFAGFCDINFLLENFFAKSKQLLICYLTLLDEYKP